MRYTQVSQAVGDGVARCMIVHLNEEQADQLVNASVITLQRDGEIVKTFKPQDES